MGVVECWRSEAFQPRYKQNKIGSVRFFFEHALFKKIKFRKTTSKIQVGWQPQIFIKLFVRSAWLYYTVWKKSFLLQAV